MRFGFCPAMGAADTWKLGLDNLETLKKLGYDYVELPLSTLASMPQDAFEQELLTALEKHGLPCLACNNFFPATIRLTGAAMDMGKITEYMKTAAARAQRVGAKVLVLGSSGARNLSQDTSREEGYRQLAEVLRTIAPIAWAHGCEIAIEPLNRMESNIVNSYKSGLFLAALSGDPHVGTLIDAYHMFVGNDSPEDLLMQTPKHVHFAQALGRRAPETADSTEFRAFFAALKKSGYDGLVSFEGAVGPDFAQTAERALSAFRRLAV